MQGPEECSALQGMGSARQEMASARQHTAGFVNEVTREGRAQQWGGREEQCERLEGGAEAQKPDEPDAMHMHMESRS